MNMGRSCDRSDCVMCLANVFSMRCLLLCFVYTIGFAQWLRWSQPENFGKIRVERQSRGGTYQTSPSYATKVSGVETVTICYTISSRVRGVAS